MSHGYPTEENQQVGESKAFVLRVYVNPAFAKHIGPQIDEWSKRNLSTKICGIIKDRIDFEATMSSKESTEMHEGITAARQLMIAMENFQAKSKQFFNSDAMPDHEKKKMLDALNATHHLGREALKEYLVSRMGLPEIDQSV